MDETILQFGTGKFLRCFLDLFAEELNQGARPAGKIVAVQSTGTERARQINRQHGRFHAAIRGLEAGQVVDRTCQVTSVRRALAAAQHTDQILQAARSESLVAIVSNTTEAGLALAPAEAPPGGPPESFPAKLLAVLLARFEAGGDGLTILPCELVERNADRLLDLVLEQAARWPVVGDAVEWIATNASSATRSSTGSSPPRADDPGGGGPAAGRRRALALWLIEATQPRRAATPPGLPVAAHLAVSSSSRGHITCGKSHPERGPYSARR